MKDIEFLEKVKTDNEKREKEEFEKLTPEDVLKMQRTSKKLKILSIALGVVATILLVTSLYLFFSKSKVEVPKVTEIQAKSPILERIETLKDAQIQALNEKISATNELSALISGRDKLMLDVTRSMGRHTNLMNKFYKDLLAIDPLAPNDKIEVYRKQLADNYLSDIGKNQNIYDIMKDNSLRKDIGETIKLITTTQNSLLVTNGNTSIYLSLVPVSSETKQYLGLYITTITQDKIDNVKYIGKVDESIDLVKFNNELVTQMKKMNFNHNENSTKEDDLNRDVVLDTAILKLGSKKEDGSQEITIYDENRKEMKVIVTKDTQIEGQAKTGEIYNITLTPDGKVKSIKQRN